MKKILPILTLAGISTLLAAGCESTLTNVYEPVSNSVSCFASNSNDYLNASLASKTLMDKYNLSVETDQELKNIENQTMENEDTIIENEIAENNELTIENIENLKIEEEIEETNETEEKMIIENEVEDIENENQISTLYSLTNDINDSCNTFCQLKSALTDAITETQNLIDSIQKNKIQLSEEEKLEITNQANTLRNLGNQLAYKTKELSFNVSDLSNLFKDENGNLDAISMRYLLVLDNLMSGNQMLFNGINSINLMNNMLQNKNMQGRFIYGYQNNNQTPVIKDYSIKDGEIFENTIENESELKNVNSEDKTLVDTYNDRKLKTNIDTFGNTRNNIDTFFNTAWLDNDFMFGNGTNGYSMNPYAGTMNFRNGYYPYVENNKVQETLEQNTINSVNENNNTQDDEIIKPKKKFKLNKNIDTYRDENTPTVSAKLTVIKDSINNFFNKFKSNEEFNEIKDRIKD